MTAFTVNSSANFSAATFAGRTGGDTYTLASGVTLTIDSDTRYGPNTSATTGPIGGITWASNGPSTVMIDGNSVRLIPYSGGGGNVPAAGTTISQGGVSATLLGVWSAINTAPVAAASAMPVSGFIKVKDKMGGDFAAGALSGIVATAKRADITGWIEVAIVTTATMITPKMGQFKIDGNWLSPFDADGNEVVVSGVRGQQIQLPGSVANSFYSFVWIEKTPGAGDWTIWPNAWPLQNSSVATDERAKQVWINGTGMLTIGNDGVNDVGLMPPTGSRIRFGNVFVVNTNSTVGYAANINATDSRSTHSGGVMELRRCSFFPYISHQYHYQFTAESLGLFRTAIILAPILPVDIRGICLVPIASSDSASTSKLQLGFFPAGGIVEDAVACRISNESAYTDALRLQMVGGSVRRIRGQAFTNTTTGVTASDALSLVLLGGALGEDIEVVGGSRITVKDSVLRRLVYSSTAFGTVPAASAGTKHIFDPAQAAWGASDISDIKWMTTTANTCHPNGSPIFSLGTGTNGLVVHDIGSRASPLRRGTINRTGLLAGGAYQQMCDSAKFSNVWFDDPGTSTELNFESAYAGIVVEGGLINSSSYGVLGSLGAVRGLRTANSALSAGSRRGVHFADLFLSDTVGRVQVLLNDPTDLTQDQSALGGGSIYNGSGALICTAVGASAEWTMPYFAQGHTSLSGVVMSGSAASNYLIEFRADTGSGWGAWMTATGANLASVSINPVVGVRLALRITCTTAHSTITTGMHFITATTLAAQSAISYPLRTVKLTVDGLVSGSRVKVTRQDTGAVLLNAAESSGTVTLTTDYTGTVLIEARKASAAPYYQPWTAIASLAGGDAAVTALQIRDDQ